MPGVLWLLFRLLRASVAWCWPAVYRNPTLTLSPLDTTSNRVTDDVASTTRQQTAAAGAAVATTTRLLLRLLLLLFLLLLLLHVPTPAQGMLAGRAVAYYRCRFKPPLLSHSSPVLRARSSGAAIMALSSYSTFSNAGSLSQRLWREQAPMARAVLHHPFVRGIGQVSRLSEKSGASFAVATPTCAESRN